MASKKSNFVHNTFYTSKEGAIQVHIAMLRQFMEEFGDSGEDITKALYNEISKLKDTMKEGVYRISTDPDLGTITYMDKMNEEELKKQENEHN